MAPGEEEELLVEEREEEMLHSFNSQKPITRKAWFLKPKSRISNNNPFYPSHYQPISISPTEAPTILFKGWLGPQRQWSRWVQKLAPKYNQLWQKVGILEAIKASTFAIRRDLSSVLGVAGFWCDETNTFIFPWGEATVTLEDVVILGGFSVTGEPVRVAGHLDAELEDLVLVMKSERRRFNQKRCKKPADTQWIGHYIEGEADELEHIAFLCLWLNSFVFPAHPYKTIGQHVIPIAVRLARGARVALATAVLASLYRDLRLMKEHMSSGRDSELTVWAPLQTLQLWVWERFLALRPKSQCFVESNEPRAARWHEAGMHHKADFSFVMSVFESPGDFQWRPYVSPLDNWCKPSFYKDRGEWVYGNVARNEELGMFAYCLWASELVGLDCIEQYLPHRVALQFGLDQDVPNYVSRVNSTWEAAWETYDFSTKPVLFYVPPRLFESDVSLQYSIWWKGVEDFSKKVVGKRRKKTQCQPHKKKRKSQDLCDTTAPQNQGSSSNSSPKRSRKRHAGAKKPKYHMKVKFSMKHAAKMVLNAETLRETQLDKGEQLGNMVASSAPDVDGDLMIGKCGCIKNSSGDQSSHDHMIDLEVVAEPEARPVMGEEELAKIRERKMARELVACNVVNINRGTVGDDAVKNSSEESSSDRILIDLEVLEVPAAESNSEVTTQHKIWKVDLSKNPEIKTCKEEIKLLEAQISELGSVLVKERELESAAKVHS